jgi:hypothetical protein
MTALELATVSARTGLIPASFDILCKNPFRNLGSGPIAAQKPSHRLHGGPGVFVEQLEALT